MRLTRAVPTVLDPSAVEQAMLFVKWDGANRQFDGLSMGELQTAALSEVRESKSYPDKQSYAGRYWAATTGRHHWFESLYEMRALMSFDRDPSVVGIATQPMKVTWADTKGGRFPDVLLDRTDDRPLLVDVKPRERIRERHEWAFSRTAALCAAAEVDYGIVCDLSEQEATNLRFLAGYRYPRWACPAEVRELLAVRAGEAWPLGEWIELIGETDIPARGVLYAALWRGALEVDLDAPIERDTLAASAGRGW
jgi:hypothetical protein